MNIHAFECQLDKRVAGRVRHGLRPFASKATRGSLFVFALPQ